MTARDLAMSWAFFLVGIFCVIARPQEGVILPIFFSTFSGFALSSHYFGKDIS